MADSLDWTAELEWILEDMSDNAMREGKIIIPEACDHTQVSYEVWADIAKVFGGYSVCEVKGCTRSGDDTVLDSNYEITIAMNEYQRGLLRSLAYRVLRVT